MSWLFVLGGQSIGAHLEITYYSHPDLALESLSGILFNMLTYFVDFKHLGSFRSIIIKTSHCF